MESSTHWGHPAAGYCPCPRSPPLKATADQGGRPQWTGEPRSLYSQPICPSWPWAGLHLREWPQGVQEATVSAPPLTGPGVSALGLCSGTARISGPRLHKTHVEGLGGPTLSWLLALMSPRRWRSLQGTDQHQAAACQKQTPLCWLFVWDAVQAPGQPGSESAAVIVVLFLGRAQAFPAPPAPHMWEPQPCRSIFRELSRNPPRRSRTSTRADPS